MAKLLTFLGKIIDQFKYFRIIPYRLLKCVVLITLSYLWIHLSKIPCKTKELKELVCKCIFEFERFVADKIEQKQGNKD